MLLYNKKLIKTGQKYQFDENIHETEYPTMKAVLNHINTIQVCYQC